MNKGDICCAFLMNLLGDHFLKSDDFKNSGVMYRWYKPMNFNKTEIILTRNNIPYSYDIMTKSEYRLEIKVSDITSKIRESKINSILNE